MSLNGLSQNDDLRAPFAYRIGVPLLFGQIADITGLGIETVYRAGAFTASILLVLLIYKIAQTTTDSPFITLFVAILVSSAYWHIKFAAFFDTLIDIYALVIVCLGWYLLLQKRLALAGGVAVLGLFVKEWPGVVLVVVVIAIAQKGLNDRNWRPLLLAAVLVAAGSIAIILPRALIDVARSVQFLDPVNDRDWLSTLTGTLAHQSRIFNVGLATLAYWLPLLLLLTRQRLALLHAELRAHNLFGLCVLHVCLVTLLTIYGGTNLNIFVGYSAPVLALMLGILLTRGSVSAWEGGTMLLVVIFFNRLLLDVPDPRIDRDLYLDHIPPFSGRVNMATWFRLLETIATILVFRLIFSRSRFTLMRGTSR